MSKCVQCDTKEKIIYSREDALAVEVSDLIGRICYPCANRSFIPVAIERHAIREHFGR